MQIPEKLIATITGSRRILVVTGAGMSAESGVPTFRDAQTGMWEKYDPAELATPEAFRKNPTLVWQWYQWRRHKVAEALPNPGHRALADWERASDKPGLHSVADTQQDAWFQLVTQNVDGLHQQAGSRNVIELHGNLLEARCFSDCHEATAIAASGGDEPPPRCPHCDDWMRPNVVWFGEALPQAALEIASHAAAHCDVFLSIGTSSLVYPAAALAETALRHGAAVIEVNTRETPLSEHATWSLRGPAGEALPTLVAALTR